jgi:hypothetical protein
MRLAMPFGILIGMSEVTTIKVPRSLRERIARDASARGVTAAALIAELVDRYERERRLAAVGRAYESVDPDYAEETAAWHATSADGLSW